MVYTPAPKVGTKGLGQLANEYAVPLPSSVVCCADRSMAAKIEPYIGWQKSKVDSRTSILAAIEKALIKAGTGPNSCLWVLEEGVRLRSPKA